MSVKRKIKKAGKIVLSTVKEILIGLYLEIESGGFNRHYPFRDVYWQFHTADARRRALVRLRERRWVVEQREGDRVVDALTRDGKIAALEIVLRHTMRRLPAGQCLLVSFDIPEGARMARQQFRRLLKQSGFKFDHLSVWCTDKDVGTELRELVRILSIKKWVHIFLSFRL